MPDITDHELTEVIVTARRKSTGGIEWFIRFKTRTDIVLRREQTGRFDGARVMPDAIIRMVDETGLLPTILFDQAVPTEILQQLMDALSLYAIQDSLSADTQTALADLFGAFDHAKANNAGIRFVPDRTGLLGPNDLMGARLDATTLQPRIINGNMEIIVNPNAANPRSFGEALHTILLHELLHLNPNYYGDAMQRFLRNGVFQEDAFNRFHQRAFYDRAERLRRIIRRNLSLIGPRNVVVGQSGDDVLTGNALDNELYGLGGNNTFTATGLCDFLWGGAGDDRYVFAQNSEAYVIEDDGGSNVLEIQGPYAKANLRIGYIGDFLIVAVADSATSTETAYEMRRVVLVALDPAGVPVVQTVEIGGAAYTLPSLTPLNNSRPELIEPLVFVIPQSQMGTGHIGWIVANDRESDPLTYSIVSVTGVGAEYAWSLTGTRLHTSFLNSEGLAGRTYVTIKVSDGRAEDVKTYQIRWEGSIRG